MTQIEDRTFDAWLNSMQESIATYEYYTDFNKVVENTESIKVQLHILNSLIGSKNIESDFRWLLHDYPEIWRAVPILIAKRNDKPIWADGRKYCFGVRKTTATNPDACVEFMRRTGLFDFIQNRLCNNLVDYVFGVETGLDTHTRKNRSGELMETIVYKYLKEAGLTFSTQQEVSEYDNKKFDFVVYGQETGKTYVIETNYYSDGGSKPSEICRAYEPIAKREFVSFQFVWITDGQGWLKERKPIEKSFNLMNGWLWNINDLKNGYAERLR